MRYKNNEEMKPEICTSNECLARGRNDEAAESNLCDIYGKINRVSELITVRSLVIYYLYMAISPRIPSARNAGCDPLGLQFTYYHIYGIIKDSTKISFNIT